MLGRPYKTVFPDAAYRQSFYSNQGQLWKERDPDGVISLYQYNAKGELEYTALDIDRDDAIDFSGNDPHGKDRITRIVRDVLSNHGYNVQRSQTYENCNGVEYQHLTKRAQFLPPIATDTHPPPGLSQTV